MPKKRYNAEEIIHKLRGGRRGRAWPGENRQPSLQGDGRFAPCAFTLSNDPFRVTLPVRIGFALWIAVSTARISKS